MLKIRMQRVGRKHEPVFRLVLTDSENGPKSGKFLEVLGSYDSRRAENAEIKNERVEYWISKGAKLSDTTHNLLVKKGFIKAGKINVLPKSVIEKARTPKESPAPQAEAPAPTQEESDAAAPTTEETSAQ